MELAEIELLINKSALSTSDKKAIRAAADAAGLKYTVKQGCRDCYERLLLRLYELADGLELNTSLDGWKFRNTRMSFQHNGVIYNNETIKGAACGAPAPGHFEGELRPGDRRPETEYHKSHRKWE